MKFPNLFKPIMVNSLLVQNRVIMAPGLCGGELMSEAGTGIVMIRLDLATMEDHWNDKFKEQHQRLRADIDRAHASGAAASCHIHHFGLHSGLCKGPSDMIRESDGAHIKAMDEADMQECIDHYTECAKQARSFGFDIVDMHLGHGWLGGQFLSPYFNKRTDEYGGSLENRARFPLRLIKAVREALGPDFPISMRWSAVDWLDGGLQFEDTLGFLKMAEPYLDLVEISCGTDFEPKAHVHSQSMFLKERMPNLPYAKKVKEHCPKLVVAVVGAFNIAADAEDAIKNGWVDMVSMSRSFIADPKWAVKAREGNDEDIIPCLRCKECYSDRNKGCTVNPRYDFTKVKGPHAYVEYLTPEITEAEKKKRVVIIGAGPAGISAAITARQRGHEVTLLEKNDYVGGALHYISMSDYKYEMKVYLKYLRRQLQKSGAVVKLGVDATPELVQSMEPDAILLGMGAALSVPSIPGIEKAHVMNCFEALEHKDIWGKKLAIIGGGVNGVEFALEQCCKKGGEAVLIEYTDTLAANGNKDFRNYAGQLLEKTPSIQIMLNTACTAVTDEGIEVKTAAGEIRKIPVDHVIYCVGLKKPGNEEMLPYYEISPICRVLGDCRRPRIMKDAILDGYRAAMSL